MRRLAIFGATGTIGASTLSVLEVNPSTYELVALTGHNNIEKLAKLAIQWQPQWLVVSNVDKYAELLQLLDGFQGEVIAGCDALNRLAADNSIDTVISAISGNVGLTPLYKALAHGKRVLLANKEPLVSAGDLMMETARKGEASIIPIDSEHSGVWQCLGCPEIPLQGSLDVRRIVLTASGGPFLDSKPESVFKATPEQACKHPNWSMGRKISVDSATMMNKGLEVIEASYLFGIALEHIDVTIHRQSIVHAMVESQDGSLLMQLSGTDMKVPIAKGLSDSHTLSSNTPFLGINDLNNLSFEELNKDIFPCLDLAFAALVEKGNAPLRLNAANEVAVDAFLHGELYFGQIAEVNDRVLQSNSSQYLPDIESIIALDDATRKQTQKIIKEMYS